MKKNKIKLEEFAKSSEFSDDIYRGIFYDLVSKYKSETPRQHLIRAIIAIYENKYPREMEQLKEALNKRKELQANEYAADIKQDMRLALSFPQSLWSRLQLLVKDPDFLHQSNPPTKTEKEELAWVMKNFPEFKIPKKD